MAIFLNGKLLFLKELSQQAWQLGRLGAQQAGEQPADAHERHRRKRICWRKLRKPWVFLGFSMVFHSFPRVFYGFPKIFLGIFYGFPKIFYGFPKIFLGIFYGFSHGIPCWIYYKRVKLGHKIKYSAQEKNKTISFFLLVKKTEVELFVSTFNLEFSWYAFDPRGSGLKKFQARSSFQ